MCSVVASRVCAQTSSRPAHAPSAGHTAWRRLRAWQAAGVWDRLHRLVLDELSEAKLIDWFRGCIDTASGRAKRGELTGRNPTDRGKPGTKDHLLVDATGLILHTLLSPANTHDTACCSRLTPERSEVRTRRAHPGRRLVRSSWSVRCDRHTRRDHVPRPRQGLDRDELAVGR